MRPSASSTWRGPCGRSVHLDVGRHRGQGRLVEEAERHGRQGAFLQAVDAVIPFGPRAHQADGRQPRQVVRHGRRGEPEAWRPALSTDRSPAASSATIFQAFASERALKGHSSSSGRRQPSYLRGTTSTEARTRVTGTHAPASRGLISGAGVEFVPTRVGCEQRACKFLEAESDRLIASGGPCRNRGPPRRRAVLLLARAPRYWPGSPSKLPLLHVRTAVSG